MLVNQAPHQLDLLLWYLGDVDEVYGVWKNANHDYIEVEDTAAVIVKFKSGAIANILVSNSQNPALYGKVHVHGDNGASVGVQTDGGAMFIAGVSTITEPPCNDLWTIKGEEAMLAEWKDADAALFSSADSVYFYHEQQIDDFLTAVANGTRPLIDGLDGRKTVELFTAIYRSTQSNAAFSRQATTVWARLRTASRSRDRANPSIAGSRIQGSSAFRRRSSASLPRTMCLSGTGIPGTGRHPCA